MRTRIERLFIPTCLAVCAAAGAAMGNTIVDLTTTTSGTINGALFQRASLQTSGTGAIESFLRLQASGTEQGYNTSGRPVAFDELTDPNFTRNLTLGQVPTLNVGGTNYYEF